MDEYTVPLPNQIFRFLARPVFRGLLHLLSPIRITGRENVPKHGPYLVAINHVSVFEAPFVLAFWPTALEGMGAVELWSRPGQALLVRAYGGLQVHREQLDLKVIELALAVLKSGRPLLIAPEGGRSHQPGLRQGHPGVAYLAEKANTPVVPVGIVGTTDDYGKRAFRLQRPPLEMHIGKPIHFPPVNGRGAERRAALQANVDLLMAQIAALLPLEYRGVYADSVEKQA